MRSIAATVVLVAGLVGTLGAGAAGLAPLPPPTVPCDAAVARTPALSSRDRTVLGRAAFPGTRVFQVAPQSGRLPYWSKVPLYVRAGRTRVTIVVPRAWRSRASVNWSSGHVPLFHIAPCPRPPNVWNVYVGGFDVREPACVPLIVRVGERNATIRLGIGRPCG